MTERADEPAAANGRLVADSAYQEALVVARRPLHAVPAVERSRRPRGFASRHAATAEGQTCPCCVVYIASLLHAFSGQLLACMSVMPRRVRRHGVGKTST